MRVGEHVSCQCAQSFIGGLRDLRLEIALIQSVQVDEAPDTDGAVLVRTLREPKGADQRRRVGYEARCVVKYTVRRSDRPTCVFDRYTCVFDRYTYVFDRYRTCVFDRYTCVFDRYTCVFDRYSCVRVAVCRVWLSTLTRYAQGPDI